MLYNKNNVRKTNDKKILHKVGKQWKVVSVALLMAIGGGAAVATHANAQSNNGVNASTSAEVAELDQKPAVASAQSVAPSSAAKSASAAKPVSNVSYLSGDNGSAAMYNAKALNDRYAAQSNGAIVNGYVKSLNAKFGNITTLVNGRVASASADAKSDAALANSYSAVANNSANKSAVNSLASKAGFTATDYEGNVQWNTQNIYAPAAKSASDAANALNMVSSLATDFEGADLTTMSAEASASNAEASAAEKIMSAKAKNINLSSASASVSSNNNALLNATVNSIEASGNAAAAMAQSSNDAVAVKSLSQQLFNNSSAFNTNDVNSEVASYAKKGFKANSNYVFSLSGKNAVTPNNASSMNSAVSNAAVMSAAASETANDNSVIASANAHKAIYSANYSAASDALKKLSAASNSVADAKSAASYVNAALSKFSGVSNLSQKESAAASLLNDAKDGRATLENDLGLNGIENASLGVKADLASMASAYGVNVFALKSAAPAIKALADAAPANVNGNNLSSAASSLASTVTSNLVSANSASASYANSTDANVVLASYYASSYSVNASSNASLASSYANDANAFYTANADASFASANNALKSATAAEPNDAALAKAFGNHVFNFAPKYLTVLKPVALYHVANSKFTRVVNVPVGTRLTVTGVQFMQNGAVRYQTSYKGKQGTVNSYKSYVQQTYLPTANGVDVTIVKPSKVYASVSKNGFGKVAAKTLPAGAKLSNVNIVSADGVYGGFTAVETQSGKFVSANIAYAEVNNANANNNQTNNGSANNSNHVSFWA